MKIKIKCSKGNRESQRGGIDFLIVQANQGAMRGRQLTVMMIEL